MTTALLTDNYELTMAQTYLQNGRWKERAVFDYFFRTLPFEGGYAVFAGLEDLVQNLQTFRFGPEELDYLKNTGYTDDFLAYLEKFEFCGDLYSPPEGEIIFPNAPILRIQGNLIEAQIIETILLNTLNFQTLIATKAARIKEVSGSALVSEFGFRRAPGLGGLAAARAAIIGGCDSTSNLEAGRRFRVPVAGTMAHSFVQTYSDELTAFRQFAKVHGSKTVLLLDTYNTLYSGLPNAISVAKELEKEGKRLAGVRLDSGDLAYLAKAVRTALDRENLNYVKIVASNQLDEYVIRSLYNQGAPIDFFGVGTSLATGLPDAALDGVYKLAETAGRPTMKFSEKLSKSTLPGCKTVWRLYDDDGMFTGDIIDLEGADFPKTMIHPFEPDRFRDVSRFQFEPLLKPVLKEGKLLNPLPDVLDAAAYKKERMEKLPVEHRRFENPHIYKVGISPALKNLRDELRVQYRQSK
ncbi:MAG TPA: nicotinate phosphoribosyltransferase [Opitutales bacterium]|nr:nicotinate phosphoribosyltransferase [Opitutales bacterium]